MMKSSIASILVAWLDQFGEADQAYYRNGYNHKN
jgi:hypothetical protein